MAEDVKADDVVGQLRDSFARQIRDAIRDLPAHQALQMADSLCIVQCDVLAGLRVRYRAREVVDEDAIRECWAGGATVKEVMKSQGVSRVTAYKYHPSKQVRRRAAK